MTTDTIHTIVMAPAGMAGAILRPLYRAERVSRRHRRRLDGPHSSSAFIRLYRAKRAAKKAF